LHGPAVLLLFLASPASGSKKAMAFARNIAQPASARTPGQHQILPTLFGHGYGHYPVQSRTYFYSLLLHALGAAIIAASVAAVAVRPAEAERHFDSVQIALSDYLASYGASGNGGGGQHEPDPASGGVLPQTSKMQITPPTVTVNDHLPILPVQPTIEAPEVKFEAGQIGDPLSTLSKLSNGPGGRAGIGNGDGGSIGSGPGPGCCSDSYASGVGGVTAPKVIYSIDPEYTNEARQARHQGTVILWAVVGPDGRVYGLRIRRPLGMGLDEKAMEAVQQYRFEPGKKDGKPVPVRVVVEVSFRLY